MGIKSSRLKHPCSPPKRAASSLTTSPARSRALCLCVRVSKSLVSCSASNVKAFDEDYAMLYIPAESDLHDLNVSWLLREVASMISPRCFSKENERALSSKRIVGFRLSGGKHEAKDQWLMDLHRSLWWLEESDVLVPVFAEVPSNRGMCLSDFELMKVIGEGASCTVLQVRKRESGEIFALKMMSKERVNQNPKRIERAITERAVLLKTRHPFIIHMHAAFQSATHLFLLLEMCPGGELFYHMSKHHKFSESTSRFYFAEALLGVEYLHQKGVLFRDLKSENILLDIDGHIRLTDFGLSKEVPAEVTQESFTSFVGTIGYLSPEMIRRDGHGRPLDYYCLGCLLYVMLTGSLPHYSGNWDDMFAKRVKGDRLSFPAGISESGKDLVCRLLCSDPALRIGAQDIKNHIWLRDIDWEMLYNKRIPPPIDPIKNAVNFSSEFTSKSLSDVLCRVQFLPESKPSFPGWDHLGG